MKKLTFLMCIFITLVSCKENTPVEKIETQDDVIVRLQEFNDNLLAELGPQTRGFWGGLWKGVRIGMADVLGAWNGVCAAKGFIAMAGYATGGTGAVVTAAITGTVASAAASYTAYELMNYAVPMDPVDQGVFNDAYRNTIGKVPHPDDFGVEINLPERFSYLADNGVLHNSILRNVLESGNISPKTRNNGPSVDPAPEPLEEVPDGVWNILESPEYKAYVDESMKLTAECVGEDYSFDYDRYLENSPSDLPVNTAKVYSLFMEVYLQYPETLEDVAYIINNYIEIIENSDDFTEEEREIIYSGFVIAAASPAFWMKQFEEES